MAEIVETIDIARSTDHVWAALANFGDISRWATNVDHSCLTTEQSEGIGAARRVQVGRNVLIERIVEWDPGERLAYSIDGLPSVVRSVTNSWRLEPAGSSTRVTFTSVVATGPRPPQRLVGRVVGKGLAKASREMLLGLKRHLEEVAV
jgi:uncharacterized protein YndB with AHSA1/START domain